MLCAELAAREGRLLQLGKLLENFGVVRVELVRPLQMSDGLLILAVDLEHEREVDQHIELV